ncbi:MAG: type III-A CRISPR-associated RAMP protein Csm5, partial [Candidatus Kryptonium sp.]
PMEYIVDDKKLKIYPFSNLVDDLFKSYKDEALSTRLSMLKDFVIKRHSGSLKEYFRSAKVELNPKYTIELKCESNIGEIKTFVKGLNGPYIPGSTIKGALRTVFLCGLLCRNNEIKRDLFKALNQFVIDTEKARKIDKKDDRSKALKSAADRLNESLKEIENKVFRSTQSDALYDVFKSIIISDSDPIDYSNLYVDKVKVINSSRNIEIACELLKPNTRVPLKAYIDSKVNLEALKRLSELTGNKLPYDKIDWAFIKNKAIEFYERILRIDMDFVERNVNISSRDTILRKLQNIANSIDKIKNSSKILIPLRLGQHKGFLSNTVMQIVYTEDKALFDKTFKASVANPRSNTLKTRRITENESYTLGWVFLRIDHAN